MDNELPPIRAELVRFPDEYELIGSKNSYFSAKVRACLQYKRIPYVEVTANIESIMRAKELTGLHVYPVVLCPDGTVLRDSCSIVEGLEQRHPARPVIPEDPLLHLVSLIMELMADQFMLQGAMVTRWGNDRTAAWARRMFSQISGERVKDKALRQQGIENGNKIGKTISRKFAELSGPDHNPMAQLNALRDVLTRLDKHVTNTPFMLGDRPSLADLGMLNGVFAHLYRDPGEISDFMRWDCISLSLWVDNMLAAAGESNRGELFVTDSLEHVLAGFGDHYGDTALKWVKDVDENMRGSSPGRRIILNDFHNYAAWRCQRLRDHYLQIPAAQRAEAERLLKLAGLLEVCHYQTGWRAEKQGIELVTVPISPQ